MTATPSTPAPGRATADDHPDARLARHVAGTRAEHLPAGVADHAARVLLWWVATALEGSVGETQDRLRAVARAVGGTGEATLLGSRLRVPAETAGLVNGRAGKTGEHEDKYWADRTIGYGVGCSVVPAALAAAEARGAAGGAVSGAEVVTAIAVATDVSVRLFRPLGMEFVAGRAAANATFALGTYAAAVAAAKVLGLDETGCADALGLAHNQAAGNFQAQREGRGVAVQAGFAVRDGITAARLAQAGVPGPGRVLSGEVGLYSVHYPHCDVDPAAVVDGLGEDFLGTRIGFKAYPCGIVAHAAIDAVVELRDRVDVDRVRSVVVTGPPSLSIMSEPVAAKQEPHDEVDAQFSVPWAVACGLRDGTVDIRHFSPAAVDDPDLRRLARLVVPVLDAGRSDTSVTIELDDGSTVGPATVAVPRGHPDHPLPASFTSELLLRSAERAEVPAEDAERALAELTGWRDVPDLGATVTLLAGDLPG